MPSAANSSGILRAVFWISERKPLMSMFRRLATSETVLASLAAVRSRAMAWNTSSDGKARRSQLAISLLVAGRLVTTSGLSTLRPSSMKMGTRKVSSRKMASGATRATAFNCLLRRSRASFTVNGSPSAAVNGVLTERVWDMVGIASGKIPPARWG